MRVVALGDIGVTDGMIHIGDEAMFESAVKQLRARGVDEFVGVSVNPADTSQRYGIESIQRIGFAPGTEAAEQRLARILALEPEAGDPAQAVIDAVRRADGVLVTGGGNLSSLWPSHVYERAALAGIAQALGKPFVISGQTLGPALDGDDRTKVAALLASARLAGVREPDSAALAAALGIPGVRQLVDDASFLIDDAATPGDYCAVTLANHVGAADRGAFESRAAELLDRIAATTGLRIIFSAHFAAIDRAESRGDSAMHARVAAHMSAPWSIEPTTDSAASARFARNAGLVVSSRYHPTVFAVAAGVPTIGIHVDDYTQTKLTGALGNFGQSSLVSAAALVGGEAAQGVERAWEQRDITRTRDHSAARASSGLWWDDVAAALR